MPSDRDVSSFTELLAQRLRATFVRRLTDGRRERSIPPRHAQRLLDALARAEPPARRRSILAEAAVAERLLANGATIELEVSTHAGRTADFLVQANGAAFFLHLKRWSDEDASPAGPARVPRSLRPLASVRRPVLVGVRWPEDPEALAAFVEEGIAFLRESSVGDEFVFREPVGVTGGLRILAPTSTKAVRLVRDVEATPAERAERVRRLLRKAYAQFMPGAANVILIVGGQPAARSVVEVALFGAHVERWDRLPARGQRVAHGRAEDGFWSGDRFSLSTAASWCSWNDARGLGMGRHWFRRRDQRDVIPRDAIRAALA